MRENPITTAATRWWLAVAFVLALVAPPATAAQIDVRYEDHDIPVTVYAAGGDRVIVWLPPEEGIQARQGPTAEGLAARGVDVWVPDLHGAWFLAPGPHSLADVHPGAIAMLIEKAGAGGRRVYVMAASRSAALALEAIRAWQVQATHEATLGGALLLHPKLYAGTPQGGETAEFLPVVRETNVPIYLFQPEHASGWWRVREIAAALGEGGAPVFMRKLPGVSDGFDTRPETRPGEIEMTVRLPSMLASALRLLDAYGPAPKTPVAARTPEAGAPREAGSELLRPASRPGPAPSLALAALDGTPVDLAAHRGEVVLVNFWATWCPPCVEEIPSLDRLYRKLRDRGFTVLAVDVGEDAATVRRFLQDRAVTFPVLLDPDGGTFKAWKAYAFPTSLLLDRSHTIRYAVYGAFDWDTDEVIRTIERLLQEPLG
ncbi:MAG: TlpA family protein disulfide reductase [Gammaproteobacteria bacterium]|nr:TlpA family protein disulfide reductase [Gammaproteobacteria bacterium]